VSLGRAAAAHEPAKRGRFWLLNRVANPLVRRILRSRFHGVLSGVLLLLTYRGRRGGRQHTLPVQYAHDGDTLYVVPGRPGQKTWWRNLRGGAPVEVRLRGQILSGTAEAIGGRDHPDAVAAGLTQYLRRFPRAAGMLGVRVPNEGLPDGADIRQAAQRAVLVRITLNADARAAT
jgi:deazaflavin-dependent oxidoreductase (nitroreductase family)